MLLTAFIYAAFGLLLVWDIVADGDN